MKIGSIEHKELFCQTLINTYIDYHPESLPWPDLDPSTLSKLRAIPFWSEAQDTEIRAAALTDAYANMVTDPLIREAIALIAKEENRHIKLVKTLINHYGIEISPPQDYTVPSPNKIETAFTKFAYGECFDSFFAFGLFEIARLSQFLPEAFFTIFDPVIAEEARHILFFANWTSYQQINQGKKLLLPAFTLRHYSGALWRRLESFLGVTKNRPKTNTFTASGVKSVSSVDLKLDSFLATCLNENQKRMSIYPPELLRPEFIPISTKLVLNFVQMLPKSHHKDLKAAQ